MLLTYFTSQLQPKLVILEDYLEQKGDKIFQHILKLTTGNFTKSNTKYCRFSLRKPCSIVVAKFECKNFTNYDANIQEFNAFVNSSNKSTLIIDSLSHMIYKYGFKQTYNLLSGLRENSNIVQIVTLFHADLLHNEEDYTGHLQLLSSLYIKVEPEFMKKPRLSYIYKKSRGKIVCEFEQYSFVDGELICKPLEKIDPSKILFENVVSPDSLTTFKIELNENDLKSRSKVNLPFLPQELRNERIGIGGNIHYELDAGDDWDVEDPDDDLDI